MAQVIKAATLATLVFDGLEIVWIEKRICFFCDFFGYFFGSRQQFIGEIKKHFVTIFRKKYPSFADFAFGIHLFETNSGQRELDFVG